MSKIIWKTQEQIDLENNQPQPITESERILVAEKAINALMMMSMV